MTAEKGLDSCFHTSSPFPQQPEPNTNNTTQHKPRKQKATVELVVERSAAPELFNIQIDDDVEVGPFEGGGLDLRTPGLLAAFRFPTVVIFASGAAGIAAARALLESPPDVAGLALPLRRDVVVYYWVRGRGERKEEGGQGKGERKGGRLEAGGRVQTFNLESGSITTVPNTTRPQTPQPKPKPWRTDRCPTRRRRSSASALPRGAPSSGPCASS